MTKTKSRPLGRGLNTLLGSSTDTLTTDSLLDSVLGAPAVGTLPLSQIRPNKDQPRKDFDEERLEELAESIRTLGLVQPITVEPLGDGTYQIIAGERRWRAAQRAGIQEIPVYIRTTNASERRELTLIENIQRQDLNAIEVALAYQEILESQELTQEELARRIGKKRSSIANYLRLLRLPAEIQLGLTQRLIDMGHARALLSLDSPSLQLKLYREILKNGYSVRKVEELCQQLNSGEDIQSAKKKIAARTRLPEEFNLLKQRLSAFFDTKVQMSCNTRGKGKISIPFDSEEELLHIMEVMDKMK